MVHDSRARTQALVQFIMENVVGHRSAFEVSDVKQDDTVFVRFRSYLKWSAMELSEDFNHALWAHRKDFVQTGDVQFRLRLDQFPV